MLGGVRTEGLARDLRAKIKKDRVTNGAASLAFYWMLALFPAGIFVLTLLPYLPIQNLEQSVMALLRNAMPGEAAAVFEEAVRNVVSNRNPGLLSFGLLFAIWSASSGVYAIMQELNNVHDVDETRPFWKARGVALLLMFAAVVLVLGSLALAVLGGVIQRWLESTLSLGAPLLLFFVALRWLIILGALLVVLALVYHFGPAVKERRFALFTPGTVAGAGALAVSSFAFKLYVGHFGSYDKIYGSFGAVIALLMWLFVTGLVFLVGAEIDFLTRRQRDAIPRPHDLPREPTQLPAH